LYYKEINQSINDKFCPDTEIWDFAGRRGKYFQGFRKSTSSTLIDLYFIASKIEQETSINRGKLNFNLTLDKIKSKVLIRDKENFSIEVKNAIESSIRIDVQGAFYYQIFIENKEILNDVLKIIKYL